MAVEGRHRLTEDQIEGHVVEVMLFEGGGRKPKLRIPRQLMFLEDRTVEGSLTYPPNPLDLEYSRAAPCG
jgi:hypothetical protein